MSLFRWAPRDAEQRLNIENPAVPLTDLSLLSVLGGSPTDAGMAVTELTSLNFSAVWRCVSLISGLGGALPLNVYDKTTKQPVEHSLLDNPHPDLTPLEFWKLSYVHRTLWGNFYAQKIFKRGNGTIQYLMPIMPNHVIPGKAKPTPANPSGKVFQVTDDAGRTHAMTSNEIFHLPGLGYDGVCGMSPIKMARQGIGLALGAEKYASTLFGSGNLTSGILQTEQRLTQQQAEKLQVQWQEKLGGLARAHRVAVLDSGAKFQSLTMPNDDAQLLESRRFQLTELGRYYGVPPFLLFDHEKSTTWGTGLEQQGLGFVMYDLHPTWLATTEQRVTKELLGDGLIARYSIRQLLRGDSIARAEWSRVMFEMGVLNANEIREDEDLPPREGGDKYLDSVTAQQANENALTSTSLGPSSANS